MSEKKSAALDGVVRQTGKERFTLRLQITAGKLSVSELKIIAQLATQFGNGEVHLTTRQGLEVPSLKLTEQAQIHDFVAKHQLITGSTGPRLRNVNACPGNLSCRYGLINSMELARQINKTFGGQTLPAKLKVAVSGCPNSCAKPQVNDLGLLGIRQPEFIRKNCTACGTCVRVCKVKALSLDKGKIKCSLKKCVLCGSCIKSCAQRAITIRRAGVKLFVGGCVGRKPKLGHLLASFLPETEAFELIERILRFYAAEAQPKERLGEFILRLGYKEFLQAIQN